MSERTKFYLTTTLPYVNAAPHLGFALEIVQADIIARYRRLLGDEVFFNTGTDEHGLKIYRKAQEAGKDPQAYADEYAAKFDNLKAALNLSYNHFIRTTDPHHQAAAQEFWRRCAAAGDIYKQLYKIKYCVGCELEKTDSELENGRCILHPNLELEIREEENYFFRFSKYQQPLLDWYEKNPRFVVPDFRLKEIKTFVKAGLADFSISRLKSKMPWGVPVPGDYAQVMYVWFDALINYISTIGWPEDEAAFKAFWPGMQLAGKDNLRQQSAMWQAMLLSAGLPNSTQIMIHGFINSAGQKMSKSLGNVMDPFPLVEKYGTDAVRYWLTREMSTFEDGDFTEEKFRDSYNANLANGIGNLVSRVLKMAATAGTKIEIRDQVELFKDSMFDEYKKTLDTLDIQKAADLVWAEMQDTDRFIQKEEPFKKIKTDPAVARRDIEYLLYQLEKLSVMLAPFLPGTAEKIVAALKNSDPENLPRLFPRLE
jgi:methionyl-tRNA synthetase